MESARLIAGLTRIVRDVGLAEDLAQEAFIAALEQWPESGVPDNPGAWLTTTARRRAIDWLRRNTRRKEKYQEIGRELERRQQPDIGVRVVESVNDPFEDDLLRLIFMCCHPLVSTDAQVALTLRVFGGLTTVEIARAFLTPVPTVAQRIVRAKRTLREGDVPFEIPDKHELSERLAAVLQVIYLIFNEGYVATGGSDWTRPGLCEEALRLGRILAELVPKHAEVHGLVALMELQASRLRARKGPDGKPVLLLDQDRSRWDRLLIERGLTALARAEELGGVPGPYTLQAAIAACHARAPTGAATDWLRITALYDVLLQVLPSPVVALNRAVALGKAFGPEVGLRAADALMSEPALNEYHLLPGVRGEFLQEIGRYQEAAAAFRRAASLTRNGAEEELLRYRAEECAYLAT